MDFSSMHSMVCRPIRWEHRWHAVRPSKGTLMVVGYRWNGDGSWRLGKEQCLQQQHPSHLPRSNHTSANKLVEGDLNRPSGLVKA